MSAVTPHLEEVNDPSETPEEQALFQQDEAVTHSLGAIRHDPKNIVDRATLEEVVMASAHAELLGTAWTRRAVEEELAGSTVTAEVRDEEVMLVVNAHDPNFVFGRGPHWNPYPPTAANRNWVRLLSWTSKMGCPSFSLPAGPPHFGGTCPGAVAGQSIVPVKQLLSAERHVRAVIQEPVNLADAVCEHCYAEGGNYRYGSMQMQQIIAAAWTRAALDDGSFVEVMDWAIKHANFRLQAHRDGQVTYPRETRGKFFRIHDSGDFFSREYFQAWKAIADLNRDVIFWAPTRIWATHDGIRIVNENNDPPNNLVIRPSTYMVNRPTPAPRLDLRGLDPGPSGLGPGWAAWTTVYGSQVKPDEGPHIERGWPYEWDCQAYASKEKGHNCRAAVAPDRPEGCRACWLHSDMSINYTMH